MFRNLFSKKRPIYLDHASSTPVDPAIASTFSKHTLSHFGNAGAIHSIGISSKKLLDSSRQKIATTFSISPEEIIFTSGGTEANNLAILGTVMAFKAKHRDKTPHIITSTIEHASVLEPIKAMQDFGVRITYLPVDQNGIISLKDLKDALTEDTVLVAIMYANNEIGSIQPVSLISKIIRKFKEEKKSAVPYFFTDACQATNYLPIDAKFHADLFSINSSKIYAPKGIGALIVRKGVLIEPVFYGGEQERSLRPGTESVPLTASFADGILKAVKMRDSETRRLTEIRDYFFTRFVKEIPEGKIWGHRVERLPNNINISIPGIFSEEIIIGLDALGISVSSKSACGMQNESGSHVILALGGTERESKESVRITLGRSTTKKDMDTLLSSLLHIIARNEKVKHLHL